MRIIALRLSAGLAVLSLFSASAAADPKLPVQMSWAEAEAFLKADGYPVGPGRDPSSLRAEDGSRHSIVFEFSKPQDSGPAICISVFDVKPIDWKQLVVRFTGANPAKLPKSAKKPFAVKTSGRSVKVRVERGDVGVYIGACEI